MAYELVLVDSIKLKEFFAEDLIRKVGLFNLNSREQLTIGGVRNAGFDSFPKYESILRQMDSHRGISDENCTVPN